MENKDLVQHNCDHYKGHRFNDLAHRKYAGGADVCIIGAGAAGGVLAYELSRAGLKVVVIESGPFWNPQTDFASDELSMNKLSWQETRLVAGNNPLTLGHNITGRGVGGGTVHFTGVFFRFHESDFKVRTLDGAADDWPITYQDLEPYYDKIERDIAVSGPRHFPWGAFKGPYPYPVYEPIGANSQLFRKGCEKLGIKSTVAPLAILTAPFEGRPPCINRGFCNQGCMPNAKFSTLIHHIPKAIQLGAEVLSDCTVTKIEVDKYGKVSGVLFNNQGQEYRQEARVVVASAFVVETPRLLFNSACPQYPDGLANSSGMVGKCIMPHSSPDVYMMYPDEVRLYKGTPVQAVTQDFWETDKNRGFIRGYSINAHGSRPVAMAGGLAGTAEIWGKKLRDIMLDYNFYARVTVVGEVLPNPANSVTLSDEKDEYGLPRALVTFSYGENDNKIIAHAVGKCQEILEAAGCIDPIIVDDTAHLMGGCRMGNDPTTSVVNSFCQSHDIPNLYICDASVFVTSGGGNPTETVMAIAARTSDYIIDQAARG